MQQVYNPKFMYGDIIKDPVYGKEYKIINDYLLNGYVALDQGIIVPSPERIPYSADEYYELVSRDEGARIRDLATELVMRLNSFDKALAYIEEMKLNYESNLDE